MRKTWVALGLMMAVFALGGCGNSATDSSSAAAPEASTVTSSAPAAKEVSLSDWAGDWNNMGDYLNDADIQEGFTKLAENEKSDVDTVKAAYVEKRHSDFGGLKIEGDTITFYDGFPGKDGVKEIDKAEYAYDGTKTSMLGDHELTWYIFKAKGDAKTPVMMLMAINPEEELHHFHMRYGKDVDELLSMEKAWFPTYVSQDTTSQQLVDEIAE